MEKAINVEHISKKYSDTIAIDDISFNVNRGEIVGFLGPNGAGKTTTMRILTGYTPPDNGKVEVMGFDIFKNPMEIKKILGYLPEHSPLYPEMTVSEYLEFTAGLKDADYPNNTPTLCGINDVMTRLIGNLSKGYQQRVGLAGALIHNPDLLILDEPTIGLDPNQIIEIRNLIKNIGKDKTVFISSHSLPEIQAVCSRVVIINKGKLVAQGDIESLSHKFEHAQKGICKVHLTCKNLPEDFEGKLQSIDGVIGITKQKESLVIETKTTDSIDKIASFCVLNKWGLIQISHEKTSLEDIFVELTK